MVSAPPLTRMCASPTPILVTGAHRTGTTWVGKMLTAGGQAAYISEPLNVLHRPGVMRARVPYWYLYICPENEAQYLQPLRETLSFRYHLGREIFSLRSRKDLLRLGRDAGIFLQGRLRALRPLIKDPFAVFSIPWFIERLNCQVVVTVRHPAAFASSLKRLDWPFDFTDLLRQPLLVERWLKPFQDDILAVGTEDILAQGALLWRIVYQAVAAMRREIPGLLVVRHEDLSLAPLDSFRRLYQDLGLDFTPRAAHAVEAASSEDNPKEISKKRAHAVRLDSRANLHNWKRRLSTAEIARLRRLTGDVAQEFYPEIGWD